MEKIRVTQHFKWMVATFVRTPIGAEGDYEIITVMQYVMQLILYTHVLILHHYIYIFFSFFTCLLTVNGVMYGLSLAWVLGFCLK